MATAVEERPAEEKVPEKALSPDMAHAVAAMPRVLRFDEARTIKEALQRMKVDEYVQFLLEHGYYDLNDDDGRVFNMRTGTELRAHRNSLGHLIVHTSIEGVQRTVPVHRMYAIKHLGLEKVRGQEVSNVFPEGGPRAELVVGRRRTRRMKQEWGPCAKCGQPDGPTHMSGRTPFRSSGERFGIQGSICFVCYERLARHDRERRKRQGRQSAAPAEAPVTEGARDEEAETA